MAWSEAARRASALVRRRHAEQRANFHLGGTPRLEPTVVGRRWRAQVAGELRAVRRRALRTGTYDWVMGDAAVARAAHASSMARYYGKGRK